jgi:hypothetical protein
VGVRAVTVNGGGGVMEGVERGGGVIVVRVGGIQYSMRHMTQHRGGAATVGHRHRRTPWPPRSVSVQCMVCVVATSSLDVFESHTVALALSAGRGALVWWQQLPRWRCSGRRLMMCTLAL